SRRASYEIRAPARHESRDRAFPRSAIAVGLPLSPPRQADRDLFRAGPATSWHSARRMPPSIRCRSSEWF
ncbi:hypothetical protein ACIQW5_28440, partial [Methylorubrum thiocyanatum]|uniref:hypothetical protein n=1 Tax=Methylorubrum thiocyanatum TaxID=47958 RepID=UPI00383BA782